MVLTAQPAVFRGVVFEGPPNSSYCSDYTWTSEGSGKLARSARIVTIQGQHIIEVIVSAWADEWAAAERVLEDILLRAAFASNSW